MKQGVYPGEGTWFNSYLVSGNFYQLLSTQDEFRHNMLDDNGKNRLDADDIPHYAEVSGNGDRRPLWMVFFSSTKEQVYEIASVIEKAQERGLYHQGIFWPFDIVWTDQTGGYLIRPIDSARYPMLQNYLGKTSDSRWSIAISLFERIRDLHRTGFTQNGLRWEQLRVEDASGQTYIWADTRTGRIGNRLTASSSSGFLALPRAAERYILENKGGIDGCIRDIYSCAVVAFNVLFFIHPFVGSTYWNLTRDTYYAQYMEHPAYNMEPGGNNQLGYQDFEQEIQRLWNHTNPELRQMFDSLFMEAASPTPDLHKEQLMDIDRWIALLKQEAEDKDSPDKQTNFPFDIIKNYQV